MPRDPQGRKRPADVIGNAVHVMRIATAEIDDAVPKKAEKRAAAGIKGGRARAVALTPTERQKIARRAAAKRWGAGVRQGKKEHQ
jgi:hypothetical protein